MRRHIVPVAAYALLTTVGLYGTAAALPESRLAASLPGTGTVDSGDIIDGQVKGADVAEGSLATVPNAAKVGGLQLKKFHKRVMGYTSPAPLFTMGSLKVTWYCGDSPLGGGFVPYLRFETQADNATISRFSVLATNNPGDDAQVFRTADHDLDVADADPVVGAAGASTRITYSSPTGTVVTVDLEGQLVIDEFGQPGGCAAWGTAIGG